ncbi:CvpA family protein [Craterilacuibacter sp.]|uniref:CvpA family protein n=1 Tax=Craterilacuibacter sp. TaxID=2870909 RepID=UPI003F384688
MTTFDYVMLAVVIGSMLIALMRGVVAEVLSLTSWLLAFWVAKTFAPLAAVYLPLPGDGIRLIGGFIVLLLLTWLATALLRLMLNSVIDVVGLGGVNKLLGLFFGLARGLMLATVLVLLGGLSDLPRTQAWQDSVLAQPFEGVALSLRPWLPQVLSERVKFG